MGLCESCAEGAPGRGAGEGERSRALLDPLLQPHRDRLWELTEQVQLQTTEVHRAEEELQAERAALEAREAALRTRRAALSDAALRQREADRAFQHMWQSQRWAVAFQGFYTMLLCLERRRGEARRRGAAAARLPPRVLMLVRDFCVQRTSAKAVLLRTAGARHQCCVEERRESDSSAWRYYMFHDPTEEDGGPEERAAARGAGAYSMDEDPRFLLSAKAATSVVGHRYLISLCPDAAAFRANIIATLRSDALGLRWTLVRHRVTVSYMDGENRIRKETGDEELVHIVYNQNITRSAPASMRIFVPDAGALRPNGAPEHPTSFNLVERVRGFLAEMESGRARKLYVERRRQRRRERQARLGFAQEGRLGSEETKHAGEDDVEEGERAAAGAGAGAGPGPEAEEGDAPGGEDASDVPNELVRILTAKVYGVAELVNAEPQWRADLQQFTLDFGGRVKESSARNFQLVPAESHLAAGYHGELLLEGPLMEADAGEAVEEAAEEGDGDPQTRPFVPVVPPPLPELEGAEDDEADEADEAEADDDEDDPADRVVYQDASKVQLQFGRVVRKRGIGVNLFSLDFEAPFSPLAAFAVALAQSTTKIAC